MYLCMYVYMYVRTYVCMAISYGIIYIFDALRCKIAIFALLLQYFDIISTRF